MANTYPHEMDKMPNNAESMRRGKILAAYKKGIPKSYADEIDERVRRALMYHQVWGWNKFESYEVAGITRAKFDGALTAGGAGIVTMGPKEWLTEELIEEIYQEITRASMDYKSYRDTPTGEGSIREMIRAKIQSKQVNTLAVLPAFSTDTYNKWMDKIGARVRKGDSK